MPKKKQKTTDTFWTSNRRRMLADIQKLIASAGTTTGTGKSSATGQKAIDVLTFDANRNYRVNLLELAQKRNGKSATDRKAIDPSLHAHVLIPNVVPTQSKGKPSRTKRTR